MYHSYKGIEIYVVRHGGGWSYRYHQAYRYGQFSLGFPSKEDCIKAAEEQIDGKRGEWGKPKG